jgi:hypothetical protein
VRNNKCLLNPTNNGNGCTQTNLKWQRVGKIRKREKVADLMKKNFRMKPKKEITKMNTRNSNHLISQRSIEQN